MNKDELVPLQAISNVIELKPDKRYLFICKDANHDEAAYLMHQLEQQGLHQFMAVHGTDVEIVEIPEKHDGKLGDRAKIWIRDEYNDVIITPSVLEPVEALSLLAWLKQEEATLQKLAKEQVGE